MNPVLREGNSDRRAPASVKQYARKNPHSMGAWSPDSKTHVATMGAGDFRSNERSTTVAEPTDVRIELVAADGTTTVLKASTPLLAGEVFDATVMSKAALVEFLTAQIADAKAKGVLFSLHLKATMMKVSDPIIFGHAVEAFFPQVFAEHGAALEPRRASAANDGLANLLEAIQSLPDDRRAAIEAGIQQGLADGPALAMVDSDRGITNLHVPSDVIVDASMPAMIRTSGQMWNAAGEPAGRQGRPPRQQLRRHLPGGHRRLPGPRRLRPGHHGLGAQRRAHGPEGRGVRLATTRPSRSPPPARCGWSTRRAPRSSSTPSRPGDIWRMCQTKDAAVQDWVKLAVTRARATGAPAVFWLDETRAHDAQIIEKVRRYLADHETDGLQIEVMAPVDAIAFSLERIRRGEDTISVTGNVLRDYLTDLFPILELGTSAKMLSIVPLMNGGGLFETGAGGSAPKHVQQLVKENYLRWDSLGEFLALAVSFEHLAQTTGNKRAQVLADTLDQATGTLLDNGKSPARRLGSIDNRGSHAYLARYWAEALAAQGDDAELAAAFAPLAERLAAEQDDDRRRAPRRAGPAGRHRRLLRPRPGQGHGGHAPVPHLQRRPRRSSRAERAAALAGRLQHGDGVRQQDPRRRGRAAASASVAGSCPASTSTPTSATRRCAAWGRDWLERGTMRARFHQPVYDGHRVDIDARRRRAARAARRGRRAVRRGRGVAPADARRRSPIRRTGPTSTRWPTRRPRRRRCSCPAPPSAWRRTASTPTGTASTSPTCASS